jgi:hypothetical protein
MGNEIADALVRLGTKCNSVRDIPIPKCNYKTSLVTSTFTKREHNLASDDTKNPFLPLLIHFTNKTHQKFFKGLDRRNSRIMTAFLDNKAPLRAFINNIDNSVSPICTFCLAEKQHNAHILFQCAAMSEARLLHLGASPKQYIS